MSFRIEGESVFSNTLMSFFYNCEFDRNYKLNRVLKKDVIQSEQSVYSFIYNYIEKCIQWHREETTIEIGWSYCIKKTFKKSVLFISLPGLKKQHCLLRCSTVVSALLCFSLLSSTLCCSALLYSAVIVYIETLKNAFAATISKK